MVEYSKVNVKLTDTQLKKLKTAVKDNTGTTLRIIFKMFDGDDLPYELLLTNALANLLNKDPKNPPDWIILEIWALESLISVDILLLNAFLGFVFCLVVNNNSFGKSSPSNILKIILKVVPVLSLTAVFSFFSCVSVSFTFTLLYSIVYMYH